MAKAATKVAPPSAASPAAASQASSASPAPTAYGYFLLRIPPQDSCALYLVRDYLMNKEDERHGGKAKARTASLILMALGQGGGRPSDERARLNDSDEAEFDPA